MTFTQEAEFEEALVHELKNKGWENNVLKYPSEEDLLKNWANILFENNRDIDRLNDTRLTDSEMQQIVEQITNLKTPLNINENHSFHQKLHRYRVQTLGDSLNYR